MRAHAGILIALACALALASCGGDEGGDGAAGDPRDAVREVIVVSSMSDDPADCGRYSTQKLLEQASRQRGRAAVAFCEREKPRDAEDPDSVKVVEVEVDGAEATAAVSFAGGSYDGQVLEVALVETDGEWKVDEVVRFLELDRGSLLRAMAEIGAAEAKSAVEAEIFDCMVERFREADDARLEHLLLRASEAELNAIAEDCLRRAETDASV